MELVVVEAQFNDDRLIYWHVWAETTKKDLEAIDGVVKARRKGKELWFVYPSPRFDVMQVEKNIYAAFNGAIHEEN